MMKNRKYVIIGVVSILFIIAIVLIASISNEEQEVVQRIEVTEITGDALLQRGEIDDLELYAGMLLESGDVLTVGSDGYVRLLVDEDKYIYVSPNTTLQLEPAQDSMELVLLEGTIINEIMVDLQEEESYEVTTPNASLSVRGTTFAVEVYKVGELYYTNMTTLEGTVTSYLVDEQDNYLQELSVDAGYVVKIESIQEEYVKYVVESNNESELWEIDLTTMSQDMLDLLTEYLAVGTNEIIISSESLTSELQRREEPEEYILTTVIFDEETEYTLTENQIMEIDIEEVTGYTFIGWYLEDSYETAYTSTSMPASDITLYAKYDKTKYTLTLDNEGVKDVVSLAQSDTIELSSPTKTGYTFSGWYDSSGTKWQSGDTMPMKDITLYASWKENEVGKYTLTTNDGSNTTQTTYSYQESISLTTLTKTGYTFNGWYDSSGTKWVSGDKMPNNDLSLTAKMTINSYTLTLVDDTQTTSKVNYGETLELETLTKTGYTFNGWYDANGNEYTTMPASNLTLTASWEIHTCNVVIISNMTGFFGMSSPDIKNYGTSLESDIESATKSHLASFDSYLEENPDQDTEYDMVVEGYYSTSTYEESSKLDISTLTVPDSSTFGIYIKWVNVSE